MANSNQLCVGRWRGLIDSRRPAGAGGVPRVRPGGGREERRETAGERREGQEPTEELCEGRVVRARFALELAPNSPFSRLGAIPYRLSVPRGLLLHFDFNF